MNSAADPSRRTWWTGRRRGSSRQALTGDHVLGPFSRRSERAEMTQVTEHMRGHLLTMGALIGGRYESRRTRQRYRPPDA